MTAFVAANLSIKVKSRIGSDRLKQLTNYDSTATTINDTVLDAASEDAAGQFRYVSGFEPDTDNFAHVAILVKGVQYFCEFYKGRDSAIISSLEKVFIRDCMSLREKQWVPPGSNSTMTIDREASGTRPDMDPNKQFWAGSRLSSNNSQIKEIST